MTKLDSSLPFLGWGQHFCIIRVRSSPHLDAWVDASPCSVMFLNTSAPSCPVWDTQKSKSVYSIFPFRDFKRQLGIWMFYNTHKLACHKNLKHSLHFLECHFGHQILNRVMICTHVGLGKKCNQVITITLKRKRGRASFWGATFNLIWIVVSCCGQ